MADRVRAPELVIEFHNTNGDVGVHADHLPDGLEYGLWERFERFDGDRKGAHSHILIRPDNDAGQTTSSRFLAASQALRACQLLVDAYTRDAENGGLVNWADDMSLTSLERVLNGVDRAHKAAQEALRMLHANTDALPRTDSEPEAPEPAPCRSPKSLYADRIRALEPHYDPRHIEAYMRLQYATLDHLDQATFEQEVDIAVACIQEGGTAAAERNARSHGF